MGREALGCCWSQPWVGCVVSLSLPPSLPYRAPDSDTLYSIQFTFDSDVDCSFLIWRHVEDTTSVDSLTNVDNLTRTE